jgi:hypothetical protein
VDADTIFKLTTAAGDSTMTTTYLGQSVQDLTQTNIGAIDFTEHYPQYLPKKGVWELWTRTSTNRPFSSAYIWLDKDALVLVDNEQ